MSLSTTDLRAAVDLVRAHPEAVVQLDEAEIARQQAATAEAARMADVAAKVDAGITARAAALVEDFARLEAEAIHDAAVRLARIQLSQELGLTPVRTASLIPAPARLSISAVEGSRQRLARSAPVPWDRQRRPADQLRSDTARALSEASEAAQRRPDQRQEAADAERQYREAAEVARRAAIAERKAARAIGKGKSHK